MKKYVQIPIIAPALLVSAALFYQNCGRFDLKSSSDIEQSLHEEHRNAEPNGLLLFSATGLAVEASQPLSINQDYHLRLGGTGFDGAQLTWGILPSSTATCALSTLGAMTERALRCTNTGRVLVQVHAITSQGSQDLLFDRQVVSTPPTGGTPIEIVVPFRIRAGTGSNPYNTQQTKVVVYVGQTLQIINEDSVNHQLHTGGRPCGHQPTASPPGGMYNCVIASAYSATNGLYDHIAGTAALLHLEAIDGRTLYTNTCQSCHGPLATSSVRNKNWTTIREAISSNAGGVMASIQLSDDQLKAISFSLSR